MLIQANNINMFCYTVSLFTCTGFIYKFQSNFILNEIK